jgi:VWFA-related protein
MRTPSRLAALVASPTIAMVLLPWLTAQTPSFRLGVDLVTLTVTVSDRHYRPVSGLGREQFVVLEDGVRQTLSLFVEERVPMDLALLLDTSSSMASALTIAKQAAIGLIDTTQPADRVMVVSVDRKPVILSPLSAPKDAANRAIARTRAGGDTALFTGLYVTLREMIAQRHDDGTPRRQAVVVLSDGRDTSSLVGLDQLMELVTESGIGIYTIMLGPRSDVAMFGAAAIVDREPRPEFIMRAFATETGGRAFVVHRTAELATVYDQVGQELAGQYLLGYVSTNTRRDGAYRRLAVQVFDRPDAIARTRAGYQAPGLRTR